MTFNVDSALSYFITVPNNIVSVSDLEPPEADVGDEECTVDIDSFWSQITKEIIANGFVTGE